MSLTIDMEPTLESSLRSYADSAGVTPDIFIARLIAEYQTKGAGQPRFQTSGWMGGQAILPASAVPHTPSISPRKAPRLQVLTAQQAREINAPSRQRLAMEIAEAEGATSDEIAQAEAEWQTLTQALNDNRRATGERRLFPERVKA